MTDLNILGIDVGKHGAAVLLSPSGAPLGVWPTPLAAKDYDGPSMQSIVHLANTGNGRAAKCYIEAPAVFGLYSTPSYTIGLGFGRWLQALETEPIGYQIVGAAKWTAMFLPTKRKGMTKRDRKEFLMEQARRLLPSEILWHKYNKETRSGIADAVLLAEWGRVQSGHLKAGNGP